MKTLVQKLNLGKAELQKNDEIVKRLVRELEYPLIELIDSKLSEIKAEFKTSKIELIYNTQLGPEYDGAFDIITLSELKNM